MTNESRLVVKADESSQRQFLRGLERADADGANVFGDENFVPLSSSPIGKVSFEVEVKYCFFQGTIDDWAEVQSFRAWQWVVRDDAPERWSMGRDEWEDFLAYHEDACGEWARMLAVASQRIRDARHNKITFDQRWVGS